MSGKADQILREKRELAENANRIFDSIFPEYADHGKRDAFFRCLPLANMKMDGVQIEKLLTEEGVSVHHSERFAVHKQAKETFLRISISSAENDNRLRQGLEIVKHSLFSGN